jgi:bisanhydrobacterioruberin hydratase
MLKKIYNQKELILISILIIFHLVGIVGINIEAYREDILKLSSMNLFISFGVIVLSRKSNVIPFILFLVLSFVLGMTYEIIGVKTSILFGNYFYGENLGIKVLEVPIVIGLNWAILAVCSGNLIHKIKINIFLKTLLASALMVFLDFLIEPNATKLDYWHWVNDKIPLYNYICWFLLSLPITLLYFKLKLNEQNKVSNVLYLILVLFFGILLSN